MAFLKKFGVGNDGVNPPPAGVNLKHSSWGIEQGTYAPNSLVNQNNQQKPVDTNVTRQKGRPGGGWGDSDDEDNQPTLNAAKAGGFGSQLSSQTGVSGPTIQVPQNSFPFVNSKPKENKPEEIELIPVDEAFLQSHEYEHKLIFDTIQPGGARVKQADTVLTTFSKAAETLSVPVIASILISKLRSDLPFISKARAIFDIEILVKRIGKHFEFFKHNLPTLKGLDFSLTESNPSNVNQLNTLVQNVIKYIQDPQSGTKPVQKVEAYTPTHHTAPKDLLEIDEPEQPHSANQPKPNAFNLFGNNSATKPQPQQASGNTQNKPNAFNLFNQTGPSTQQPQPATANAQNKTTSFGFIKGGSTSQAQPKPTPTTNKYDAFLELDLNGNSGTTPTNGTSGPDLMGLYGNQPVQQQPSKGIGSLSSLDFGASPQNSYPQQQQQQPQNGAYGYGYAQPQQQYQQYQQPQGYQQPYPQQAYPQQPYNSYAPVSGNNGLGGHLDALESNYQGMPNLLGQLNTMTPEADKKKKEQEQEAKFFDFVKF